MYAHAFYPDTIRRVAPYARPTKHPECPFFNPQQRVLSSGGAANATRATTVKPLADQNLVPDAQISQCTSLTYVVVRQDHQTYIERRTHSGCWSSLGLNSFLTTSMSS